MYIELEQSHLGRIMSGPTSPEEVLRARARVRLQSGALPTRDPVVSYAGSGSGAACALCDEPVAQGEWEFELDFAAPTRATTLHMHFQCQKIWYAERAAVRSAERSA